MRSQDDIVARLRASDSFFGFDKEVLLRYLDFDHAREFLKPEATEAEWVEEGEPLPLSLTREQVVQEMADYFAFAVGKALDHRGLSAGRSIERYQEWVWLLGDGEYDAIPWTDYPQYGVPILDCIARRFSIPVPIDPAWQRMAAGQPCHDECEDGCGL